MLSCETCILFLFGKQFDLQFSRLPHDDVKFPSDTQGEIQNAAALIRDVAVGIVEKFIGVERLCSRHPGMIVT
jgi:hypothetical protein